MLDALKNVLVTVTIVALDVLGVYGMLWHRVVVAHQLTHTHRINADLTRSDRIIKCNTCLSLWLDGYNLTENPRFPITSESHPDPPVLSI
jgi:hypothetical protein